MIEHSVYYAERNGGKTNWLLHCVEEEVQRTGGSAVAILVPTSDHFRSIRQRLNLTHYWMSSSVTLYSEASFWRSRGGFYSHIFVDNADLFDQSPFELCSQFLPGISVTMTATPDNRSALPRPTPVRSAEPAAAALWDVPILELMTLICRSAGSTPELIRLVGDYLDSIDSAYSSRPTPNPKEV